MQPGGYFDHGIPDGGYLWSKVQQSCLHDNIRLGNKTSSVFFSALYMFVYIFVYIFMYFCLYIYVFHLGSIAI